MWQSRSPTNSFAFERVIVDILLSFHAILMLAFGGCTPNQDVARCQLEIIRLYPDAKWYDDVTSRYVRICMTAKGYEPSFDTEDCRRRGGDPATQTACYKSTGWLARFLQEPRCGVPGNPRDHGDRADVP
jgi:hypothetical protein